MAQIFPRWTNKLPLIVAAGTLFALCGISALIWWFGSPEYTDVGYQPDQPVDYSHKLHAGDLGMDCRYCHTTVETGATASVPPTQTCMNCHALVKPDSKKLAPVIESWNANKPLEWIRIHKVPDYAYFNHSIHINSGVGCISCHGNIAEMEKVSLKKPLSMGWCLDCHRNPGKNLRPVDQVTNMSWEPDPGHIEWAGETIKTKNINPTEDCSGCHR